MNNFIEKDSSRYFKIRFLDIYMAGHNGFIAGGCFKNIFLNEKIKDVDIFFENISDFNNAVNYYLNNDDYVESYENTNTKAFKNTKTNIRVELVRSQFGTPKEILEKFDFSITKFCYYKKELPVEFDGNNMMEVLNNESTINYSVIMHEDFFDDLINKKLVLEPNILFPVSTFERTLRYTKYGYGLCRESKFNLLNALKTAEITNLSADLYFGLD